MCDQNQHGQEEGKDKVVMVSRREMLKIGAGAGAGIMTLGPWGKLASAAAMVPPNQQTRVVLVNLYGGHDSISAVIPYTLSALAQRRPNLLSGILNGALPLNGNSTYKLSQYLPALQAAYNEGSMAVVTHAGFVGENQSHFDAQDIHSFGLRAITSSMQTAPQGWVARYAQLAAPTPMGAVALGVGRPKDIMGRTDGRQSMVFATLDALSYQSDVYYPNNAPLRSDVARGMLDNLVADGNREAVRQAGLQGRELASQIQAANVATTVSYGTDWFSPRLRDVARLIQGGFPTRIFYTGLGGFDTHSNQQSYYALPYLYISLNAALNSFIQDMKNMGEWNRTVVVLFSEFGRRNYENASNGTDHGWGYSMIVLGGAVHGGFYGAPISNDDVNSLSYPVRAETDFRVVFNEILKKHLNISAGDRGQILPQSSGDTFSSTDLGIL